MELKEKIHFIGLGGIGMSGIARMYMELGHPVQGSDVKNTPILSELQKQGARVLIGHDPRHLEGAKLVVYSSSIKEDHPERVEALRRGIRLIHRADALAALCREKFTLAIAGTHGKTTTTALVGLILKEAGHDPSVVVGGVVELLGGNARTGQGREMVIEADESDASFLKFSPDIEIITNIEKEHLDFYGTVDRMEQAYRDFILRLRPGGRWIACAEDPCISRLAFESQVPVLLYGLDPSYDFYATEIIECPQGTRGVTFQAWHKKKCLGLVKMKILGKHNVLNALGAIAATSLCGVDFSAVQRALEKFEGAGRRFDIKYESPDTLIVDDYAHHPTEIKKTLAAARVLAKKRILAVFQPHRFSRTEDLLSDFATSFGDADQLLITDIYAAGEKPLEGISGERVSQVVRSAGHPDVAYVPREEVVQKMRALIRPGDLVIALGAGDVYQVAKELSFFRGVRGKVLAEEPLSRHTSIKIGGPAEYWIEPEDVEDLKNVLWECRTRGLRVRIFGAGSNVLAADEGVRGVVLHLGAPYFRQMVSLAPGKILARAGVMNNLLIQYGLEKGLGGFEFLSGIPGSIGGAVVMNAGSHNQSVDEFLQEVLLLDLDGNLRWAKKEELSFQYRSSGIKNQIVLEAVFLFPQAPLEKTKTKLEEYHEHRAKTQDLWHASAGCLFKNPEKAGCSSGRLIDEAGLKGFAVGKAQVSEKHANFLINLGGATSKQVQELMVRVRETVKEKTGIELETEVRLISDIESSSVIPAFGVSSGKIAVLAGGPSCEREISLISGKAVFEALKNKGFDVLLLDPVGDFVSTLKSEKVVMVFLALHGTFGEDGVIQKMLEEAGLAYTGSGPVASELAFDKSKAQTIFKREGILVPEFALFHNLEEIAGFKPTRFPVVVKPACSGSSVGVTIVSKKEDVARACEEAFRYSPTILVEEYIAGRELTVGILAEEALPIVEVIPSEKFYDYQAKYKSGGTQYEFPAKLTPEEVRVVHAAALKAYRALGCRVMARVDVILSQGEPYVLEVNTIPGLTGKSLLPKAAQAAGIEFGDLCVKIMQLSTQPNEVIQKW